MQTLHPPGWSPPVGYSNGISVTAGRVVFIAGQLGLTPESLSRAFARLRSVGVTVEASHVVVRDVAKLRALAADDRSAVRGTLRTVR